METHRLRNSLARFAWIGVALLSVGCSPPSSVSRAPPAESLEPWPFTLPEVTLSCGPTPPQAIFVTTPDGRRFAVNGSARSEAPLMRDIQAIVDLQPLIQRGRLLCDGAGSVRLVARPAATAEPTQAPPPQYRIEEDRLGGGFFAIAEADQDIGGRRPELALGCADGRPNFVSLNVVTEPRTPPPLRGVFAEFEVGARTFRYEMSWGLNDDWMPRSGDDRAEDAELARAILAHGSVVFRGDRTYMPARASWSLEGFGDQLNRIRRDCGL